MSWINLGRFELTSDWQFSQAVEGEIFRISHQINGSGASVRGVIAQGFLDSRVNVYSPQLFNYREETEILALHFPDGLNEHSLCFKRLDETLHQWFITVEVFQGTPEQNLQNYLITRFGGDVLRMALYPLLSTGSTTPKSYVFKLQANTPIKLLEENLSRTELRVWTTGHAIRLCTGVDDAGKPLEILMRIAANYFHNDIITSAGMYKGNIYAISEESTNIYVTELSAK